jgi:hypothetical protein
LDHSEIETRCGMRGASSNDPLATRLETTNARVL